MKKFISLLLVLTMCFSLAGSLGVTALADEGADAAAEAVLPAETGEAAETVTPAETEETVPETEPPAPEAETDADIPAEDPVPETEAEETALPELFTADALPEEALITGADLTETVSQDAQAAETEASYRTANNFVEGQNYIIVVDGKAIANNSGTITTSDTADGSDTSTVWTASQGDKGMKLMNGSYNLYYSATAITADTNGKGNWNYAGGKLYYAGQGQTYVSGISGTSVTASTSDGCAVTIYTDGTDLGTASGGTTGGGDNPPPDGGDTSVQYAPADTLTAGNAAFVVSGFTFGIDKGSIIVSAAAIGADGKLTVETANWLTVVDGEGGKSLVVEDPPGSKTYLVIDEGGLQKASAPGGAWAYADGHLSYTDGGTTYYITGASADGVTTGTSDPAQVTLYTGDGEPKPAPPPSSTTEADAAAPIIVKQPAVVPYVIEGSGYAAPTYTVEARLPEGSPSQSIYFQWYVDGKPVGDKIKMAKSAIPADGVAACTITIDELAGKTAGMYGVYCEVICNTDGGQTAHTTQSNTVRFLICKGIKENSFITFSDVHETFDNVGTAVYNTMIANDNYAPALIICTGDWANGHYMGGEAGSDNYNTTMDDYIARLRAQAAGIDMIFISGNHDNGAAAADATVEAGLGAEEGYDGLGLAYDSRAETTGSSAAITDDLVVFGINYDQLVMDDGTYSYAKVLPKLEAFLKDLKDNSYKGKVVISAHAGLHVLGIQDGSDATDWNGDNEYNVDKSDEMVALINEYAKDMTIMYFFGHDHSKGESEFSLKPGDNITSTTSFSQKSSATQAIQFYYGHAGYITNDIGGQEKYTAVSWNAATPSNFDFSAYFAATTVDAAQAKNALLEGKVTITTNAVSAGGGNTGDTNGGGAVKRGAPPTGDESSPVLWAAVLVLCIGGGAALLPRKKRN